MLLIRLGGVRVTLGKSNKRTYVIADRWCTKAVFSKGLRSVTSADMKPIEYSYEDAQRISRQMNETLPKGSRVTMFPISGFRAEVKRRLYREQKERNKAMEIKKSGGLNLSAIHKSDNGDGSFNLRIDEDVLTAPKTNGVLDTFDALGESVPGAVNYTPEVIAEVDAVEGGSLDELSDDPFLDPVMPEDADAVSVERLTQEMLNAPFMGAKSYNIPEPKFIKCAPDQEHTLLEVAVRNYIDAVRKLEEVRKLAQLGLGTNGESYDAAIEDELNLLCNAEYNGVSITEITKNLIGYQRMRRAIKSNERILAVLKTFEILPAGNSQAMEELEASLSWGKEGDCIPVSAPVQFAKKHGEF